MGFGDYSYEAHQAIATARAALPAQKVFNQRRCHPLMNPHGVQFPKSRDSDDHPRTVSIAFALDVSGSMGSIPEQIAKQELPGFMKTLLDCGVTDPQVLFMALQDCADTDSSAPLQVGQFESTAELMDQWLTRSWIMGGGASIYESYDLALWFAARHLKMDSWEKRKKKGYFFMTGDETCYPNLFARWTQQFLGEHVPADIPLAQVVAEAQRTLEVFFIVPDQHRFSQCGGFWQQHLGQAAIGLAKAEDTCPVAAGAVAITEGAVSGLRELGERLRGAGYVAERVQRITTALEPWAKERGKV
ncbi:MAG: hypothetical protein WKG00_34070 [Polyangiaceae bacterium]